MKEKIYKVSELNSKIKKLLESNYPVLQIQGELSGVTHSQAGHFYFRLKDELSQVSCVFFRFSSKNIDFIPQNGEKVIVFGRISLYEPQGSYQIIVEKISPLGAGELQIRFEELKRKLQEEGLFDVQHKKNIPAFPQKIGLVTSWKGAALQDILKILKRRAPQIEILIANSLVQGAAASKNLVSAIELLETKELDLILITRGGGSMEDLWCFNDEQLARKIFSCTKPTISAIGHESDFTICDLVADKRAATPSEAAEILSSNNANLLEKIQYWENSLRQAMQTKLDFLEQKTQKLTYQLGNPLHQIQNYLQRLDDILEKITQNLTLQMNKRSARIQEAKIAIMQNPLPNRIVIFKQQVQLQQENIKNFFITLLQQKEKKFLAINTELQLNNPLQALKQGYARISNKNGVAVKKINQVQIKDLLQVELQDGKAITQVQQIMESFIDKHDE